MQSLVSPVLDKFMVLLNELIRLTPPNQGTGATAGATDAAGKDKRTLLAQCLSHAMSAIAWSSKAFNNAQTIKASGCLPVYLKALEVFLRAIQVNRLLINSFNIDHIYRRLAFAASRSLPGNPGGS